jgi:hypothetical protein
MPQLISYRQLTYVHSCDDHPRFSTLRYAAQVHVQDGFTLHTWNPYKSFYVFRCYVVRFPFSRFYVWYSLLFYKGFSFYNYKANFYMINGYSF